MKKIIPYLLCGVFLAGLVSCERNEPTKDSNYNWNQVATFVVTEANTDYLVDEYGIYYTIISPTTASVAADINNTSYQNINKTLIIPEKIRYNNTTYDVVSIQEKAFANCLANIEKVILPSTLQTIGQRAFENDSAITATHYKGNVASWLNIHFMGNAYANPICYSKNLYIKDTLLTDLIIPDNIETINFAAFFHCESLKSIHFGTGLKTIEASAFNGCKNISELNIPDNVTKIDQYAFYHCSNITTISMSKNISYLTKSSLEVWTDDDTHSVSLYMKSTKPFSIEHKSIYNKNEIIEDYITLDGISYDKYTIYTPFGKTYTLADDDKYMYNYYETIYFPVTLYIPINCYDLYDRYPPWLFCDMIIEENMNAPQVVQHNIQSLQSIGTISTMQQIKHEFNYYTNPNTSQYKESLK